MMKKKYSAFVSSAFESLRDERQQVIDVLLDKQMFPVCMEHFTASSSGKFGDLERLIDDSDFFILLLGGKYGSCDENGLGWTEREYDYAMQNEKHVLAILCDEYVALLKKDENELTDDEKKQLAFGRKIEYARAVSSELPIPRILHQFLSSADLSECAGWVRQSARLSSKQLEEWQNEHLAYDLSGTWYHLHLSVDDDRYIRLGTISISQCFTPENFRKLSFDAFNYNLLKYDPVHNKLTENVLKRSHWTGEYTVDETGATFGIFQVRREFKDAFGEHIVDKGVRRGIHDFTIDVSENTRVESFHGEFHDEAPSPKSGIIFVFRTPELRIEFLKENFPHLLEA